MARSRCLVIGLGNPLQGDDGFGHAVLGRLETDPAVAAVADLLDAGTDLLGHLDRVLGYRRVVLVDACLDPLAGGEVAVVAERDTLPTRESAAGAHGSSPAEAIAVFRVLHPDAPVRVDWVLWCVPRVGLGPGLSVRDAAERGAEAVRTLLRAG